MEDSSKEAAGSSRGWHGQASQGGEPAGLSRLAFKLADVPDTYMDPLDIMGHGSFRPDVRPAAEPGKP